MLKNIKNIVFDLGGVIINLNQDLTFNAFNKLFPNNFQEILEDIKSTQLLDKFETSEISRSEFYSFFKNYNKELNENEIDNAWNSMLLDIPDERIQLIKKLSEQYSIYLLSNTNEIHYQFIERYINTTFSLSSFNQLFNKVYLSHEINLRKSNPQIFEYVLNDASIIAQETLFIDDSIEHINSAKSLGIKTQHLNLQLNQSITQLFNEH